MIPVLVAGIFVIGIITLAIYSLADNDRLYGSIIAAIFASLLSFILAMNFIFVGILDAGTSYTIPPVGWLFMLIGIVMVVVTLLLIVDTRNVGVAS